MLHALQEHVSTGCMRKMVNMNMSYALSQHYAKNILHELVRFNNHPCMCMTACDVTHTLEISIPIQDQ